MPGSAENLSDANTILNTAVAKALKVRCRDQPALPTLECAAAAWVKKTLNEHRRVIFNGNGYSDAWEAGGRAPRPAQPQVHPRTL